MFTKWFVLGAVLVGLAAGASAWAGVPWSHLAMTDAPQVAEQVPGPKCCYLMKPCCPKGPCCPKK